MLLYQKSIVEQAVQLTNKEKPERESRRHPLPHPTLPRPTPQQWQVPKVIHL